VVAGKPQTPLHAEAVARTGAKRPLVVGDRLDTDIEGAVRGGTDSLLVLTGVSGPRDAVLARPGQRPTYLAADLGGLLEPQPAIGPRGTRAAGGGSADRGAGHGPGAAAAFGCGGWQARGPAGPAPLELTGGGAWIDGLRALCAAAWSGEQVAAEMAAQALEVLGPPR
jgi:glycerol 3-phosphatase-2